MEMKRPAINLKRRTLLAGGLPLPFWAAHAQASPRRIGFLYPQADLGAPHPVEIEIAMLGYHDGRNAVFVRRFADGKFDRLPLLAGDLLAADVEIIVASSTAAALAAKQATTRVPIVVLSSGDAVGSGLVQSLARPGGNVTGNSFLGTEFAAKQVELMSELRPHATRIGFMANSRLPPEQLFFEQMRQAANKFRLTIEFVDTQNPREFDDALARAADQQLAGLICAPGGYSDRAGDRKALLEAIERRPTLCLFFRREYPEEGGLVSQGPSWPAMNRQAAMYVDRILKGARASDLPIVQPTRFELVINMRTARRMAIDISSLVLARADEVIE
jgi:putative ABC transport system substrate-binding protein